jgi:hypothetical protein
MKHLPRRLISTGFVALGFAIIFAVSSGQATTPLRTQPPNWGEISSLAAGPVETTSGDTPASLPPPAEQNPCLHCHIAGEIEAEWSPISRWFVFGAMGLTFVFGLSRNFMVWRTRELWHHRWMLHLSRITAIFFVLQLVTGVSLIFLHKGPEIILRLAAVIDAVHWGSGIILFIAALALSFAGALLPWYQRPFWAMIFITGLIGGALAVANLSFTYLYADWHLPPPPSRLYAFHMLLIPIAIAGIMSIAFIVLRKRGETQ